MLHGNGGGPYGGSKPASEGTGQAKACPTRPAIEVKQPSTRNADHLSYDAAAPRTVQVVTPGRGIYHDGRTLARGFQDGNQLGRRWVSVGPLPGGAVPGALFARKLIEKMPGLTRVYYSNSGSEANEKVYKMVRQIAHKHHGGRKWKILYRDRDYHGTTIGTLATSGQDQRAMQYGPYPDGFVRVPHCLEYRKQWDVENYGERAADAVAVEAAFDPAPGRGIAPLRMRQPHHVVDRCDGRHCQPAGQDIGGGMEQVDAGKVHRQRQVQQSDRAVGRTAHHQLVHIGRPAQRLLAQGIAQQGEFAIGREFGQVPHQGCDTFANAARAWAEIAAIDRDPGRRWSDYAIHLQAKSARFRFIGKIPRSAASDSLRSASVQPFAG